MAQGSAAAYVTLALVPGIGRARIDRLLEAFPSAAAVLEAPFGVLEKAPGLSRAAATAVAQARVEDGERVLRHLHDMGGVALLPDDARFPARLAEIPEVPALLFALGRVELLQQLSVAVVGSRTHTRYGAEVCRHFAGGLARAGLVIVSGMARGLDAMAHTAALDAGGGTVGVLGNGLGVVYPAANRALYERVGRDGCLLTEFPPGDKPHAGSFPRRNRLISGLARVTLVVEARAKSGALITADCALAQGRELLAVPGPITSPISVGCNQLIQQGAKPALGLRDVLEEFGIRLPGVPSAQLPTDLTAGEQRALQALADGESHVDDLATRLHMATPEVLSVMTSLEIRGLVGQEGKVFRRAERVG